MKIPCVRCGKKIDSPHVYCRDCSRELEDGAEQLAAPKKRPRFLLVLLVLVALAGAGVWGYDALPGETFQQKLAALKKDVPTVEIIAEKLPDELTPDALKPPKEPETPPESARPSHPAQEDEVLFTLEEPSSQPGTTQPDEQQAAMDDATQSEQQNVSEEETPGQVAQDDEAPLAAAEESQEATQVAESTQEQPGQDEAAETTGVTETDETAPEVQQQQQEQQAASAEEQTQPEPEAIEDGVWVYWMDKEGVDKKTVERLQEAGFVNSQAKGQWPGHFNDKNIFYRHEDKRGLDRLQQNLQGDDFYDYYYNNDRIGQNVKRIFNEHDNVQFVIIMQ